MKMQTDRTMNKFLRMDLSEYAGYAVGIINGKIEIKNKDPTIVLERLMSKNNKNKDIAFICVPNLKTAMSV